MVIGLGVSGRVPFGRKKPFEQHFFRTLASFNLKAKLNKCCTVLDSREKVAHAPVCNTVYLLSKTT